MFEKEELSLKKLARRDALAAHFNAYKLEKGCSICGYNKNPLALQFHHLRDKKYSVSYMISCGLSFENVQKEVDKCEVVCANCHMILHNTPHLQRSDLYNK